MKKRVFSMLLVLCLCAALLPMTALAAAADETNVSPIDSSIGVMNPDAKLAELNDGRLLCVYIDEVKIREGANKNALFYMVYQCGRWEEPVVIDNDGTVDAYPNLSDLGNGQILITWSSADNVVSETATTKDAMKSMHIKAALFDKADSSPGTVMQVTKATTGDCGADMMASAAYRDLEGNLILYYTKTGYDASDASENILGISGVSSLNAYMIYNGVSWSDADDYTNAELAGLTGEEKEAYKENWYGQRALDLSTRDTEAHPTVIDTASVGYGDYYALFAYTVDQDGSTATVNDRDVFMQVYNFQNKEFEYIVRLTSESGAYFTPKFETSDYATYLFYGDNTGTQDGNTAIHYIRVNDLIDNPDCKEAVAGDDDYYISKCTTETYSFDRYDITTEKYRTPTPSESDTDRVPVRPSDQSYNVNVTHDGNIYLFWTDPAGPKQNEFLEGKKIWIDVTDEGRLMAAFYDGSDAPKASESDGVWSRPVAVALTNETGMYYSGIGTNVVDNKIFAVGAECKYNDEGSTRLVSVEHYPSAEIRTSSVEVADGKSQPSSQVTLRATVTNEGLKKQSASAENPIKIYFTVNDGTPVSADITTPIPGGDSVTVDCVVTLPEDLSNVVFGAYTSNEDKVTAKLPSITQGDNQSVAQGSRTELVFASDADVDDFKNVILDEGSTLKEEDYTKSGNAGSTGITLTADYVSTLSSGEHTLGIVSKGGTATATFHVIKKSSSSGSSSYAITVDETQNGSVSVSAKSASEGTTVTITTTPDKGWTLETLTVLDKNGEEVDLDIVTIGEKYTFKMPSGKVTVTATFMEDNTMLNYFVDVNAQDYFYDAVLWAAENGVTSGTDDSHFSPNAPCTRAQIVTFLWRAAGSPVVNYAMNLSDVSENTYYAEAVRWALSEGITKGTSDTTFSPDATCTRAQAVTFLYRASGSPAVSGSVGFDDVADGAYYADAVKWAAAEGITEGTSTDTFSPDNDCTRAQIVTFLWRAMAK